MTPFVNANAVLPPGVVLDRLTGYPSSMAVRCRPYGPNPYDDCLDADYADWMGLLSAGGLKACCPQGRRKYTSPPWVSMPSEGRRFRPISTQPLTAFQTAGVFNGLDVIVLQERVPLGYDGVITEVIAEFTGTGFQDGRGDIIWRLAADFQISGGGVTQGRFLRDYGNVQVQVGSFQFPSPVPRGGLRVYSWDLITFYANIPAISPVANGQVICGISGWFWPR